MSSEKVVLPIAYCLLPIAYCLLPIAYCLLPIAYCLLPIAILPFLLNHYIRILNLFQCLKNLSQNLILFRS
ncbi:hypothetical protein DBR28_19875 [Chryseobacterium sp. HMWF028]|nr:hypothetical protein DBR28_19875 [Chryseobacterium sp. HMWF028]